MGIDNERNDSAKPFHDPLIGDVLSVESVGQATSISSQIQGDQQPGDAPEEHIAYWKQQLQGADTNLHLPTDRPYPAVHTFVGAWQAFELPQALTSQLTLLSQQEGVSLLMTLIAAFQILLFRYSGQDDFLIGTSFLRDSQARPFNLPGLFANFVVLRSNVSGNPSFRGLLERVRQE